MILTDHPATCVSAGAGSGKSTTLVLRVVYMLEYLNIPDQDITVISFTANSCDELRSKLIKIMSFWRPNVSEQEWKAWSKEKVRTFHSLLHRMAQSELPGRSFFELIKKGEADQFLEDTASGDIENPASGSRLNEVQVTLLAEAYRSLFCSDADFRQAILELLRMELASKPHGGSEPIKPGLVYYSAERDADVIKRSNQTWMGNGWPFEGIVEESIELANLSGGKKFLSNGVHQSTRKPVVLGFAPGLKKAEKDRAVGVGKAKTAFAAALAARTRILANHAQKDYIYIKDEAALETYLIWDKYVAQSEGDPQKSYVPMFKVKLDGEIKPILIYESLFAQGSFVETLGMDVVALLRKMPAPQRIDATVHFYRALGRYWPHLNEFLRSKKLHTFNRAFLMLSRSSQLSKLSTSAPSAMRHLLVDEFQDISPLIVSWLKSAQRTLLEQDQVAGVSIMAIGDDWQSIYGWRGSSPQLFIDFNRHFPVHTSLCSTNPLLFRENFRSVSAIVVDAARLIDRVQKKVTKECISKIKTQAGDHGVKLMTYGDAE
ncbi:UvrD-helicase domain-containing protein [Xanthomonas hawaiiensis]|nr:UvrD-helicase domain-containing protein [Xanthomonas sp. A6251]MBO9873955.1 UvrD-helicase domain-containing protein [Xanthomonas sp. D-93]WNH43830.1 UvrD-helicase domain-containing protein [Xanthomonas sp. A6251]